MSYLYAPSSASATGPGANAYPHSPYASTTPTVPPHSPYVAAGQPQAATAYTHSPYAGVPGSTLAPSAAGVNSVQAASPLPGQVYLPSGGQLTVGTAAATPATPAQPSQPFMSNVQPGAMTYTTTTDALGRVTYHHFRAEPATYRSPQGVTYTGIQWVPTETSSVPPTGIAPAGPEVLASFRGQIPTVPVPAGQAGSAMPAPINQGFGLDYRDDREWEKEERRRKREEKRRNSVWETERAARERAEDRELRKARERDAELDRAAHMRRPSYGGGLNVVYDRERSRVRGGDPLRERDLREREELERRMGDLDVNDRGDYYEEYGAPGTRSRRQSMSARAAGAGIYDEPAYDRDDEDYGRYPRRDPSRRRSGIYAAPEDTYDASERSRPASIYAAPAAARSRPNSIYAPERSPYRRTASPLHPADEVYPPGHILAGQPVRDSGFASSRNPSPNLRPTAYSGGLQVTSPRIGSALSPRLGAGVIPGASPRIGAGTPLVGGYGGPPQDMLPSPEAFSRPLNRAQAFTPFNDIRVQDMDELLDDIIHPMPGVLSTHDVLPEDWGRLMHDLMLAWKGRLPLPEDKPIKRSDLIIDILGLWNTMFFVRRFAELVLYKGRNCKSGLGANLPETRLLPEQLVELDDSGDESEEESEEEYADQYDRYGSTGRRSGHSQRREIARQQRRKQKIEEKVKREMDLNKRYTLWLKYAEPREREY